MTPRYFLKIAGPPSQCGGCRPPWQHLVAHAGSKQRIRLAHKPLVMRIPWDGRVHLRVACKKRDKRPNPAIWARMKSVPA